MAPSTCRGLARLKCGGLTLEEARQRITAGYSQFLRRPLVYLDLVEQRPVRVTVTGQVLTPRCVHAAGQQSGVYGHDCDHSDRRRCRWRRLADHD
ncbi:MAG: hypothetical protein CM15mP116_11060 [Synechococcus sp.]|nr:MAG: hypothetical protein CM15mP116_11060 [Synechococcus sp.]